MPALRLAKYHGLGNDFVILDRLDGGDGLSAARARELCDRHRGVGADGVLTVWPGNGHGVVARMQVQNADGSEAEMCGNGLRCVARYLHDRGVVSGETAVVEIEAGGAARRCERLGPDRYSVEMGSAAVDDPSLPPPTSGEDRLRLEIRERVFEGTRLSMGNPHFVDFASDDPRELAERFGAALEGHPAFPNRVNASFARVAGSGIEAVVFERGVGITGACGSGACAIAAAAVRRGLFPAGTPIEVRLPGGSLEITVARDGAITMVGEAVFVFDATVAV